MLLYYNKPLGWPMSQLFAVGFGTFRAQTVMFFNVRRSFSLHFMAFNDFNAFKKSLFKGLQLLRSCLGLLYVERRGSVFYRLDSFLGGVLVATLGGLVQYSRDHGWEHLGHEKP